MAGQKTFSAVVSDWVAATQERMTAVFRLSAEYVIENVIELTPVDTGFLRASLTVTTDGPLPIRPDARPARDGTYELGPYSLVINGAELGQTVYASFVASYSAHVEYGARGRAGRGMVRLAAQRWPEHVDRATAAAKARVASRQN